jgi:hypothetical protein
MTDELKDEPDLENPFVQYQMFTDLFHELEACDSKRVDDFWEIVDETVLEVLNPARWTTDDRDKSS